jgi:hypothetical protein
MKHFPELAENLDSLEAEQYTYQGCTNGSRIKY